MPVRNLVPKPLQAPHPPLWVAAPRQSAVELAAQIGAGALCLSLDKEPADAAELVAAYERVLQSEACVPAGHAVNPRLAFVLPMLCHADEATALDRGLDSAQFFLWALMYYLLHGSEHAHGEADLLAEFHRQRAAAGWDRSMVAAADGRLRASFDRSTPFGVRGAIGTPGQLRELLRGYEEAGADQVTFLCQVGDNRHEHICESMELFAREVMPEFAERHADREARKRERLAGAIDAALARRVDLTAPAAAVAAASADGTLDGYYGEAPQVVR
jgi:alkanesulfonate monooxygenase SsuD/methylene tetrahydromethanopterin reductase-like flavin-dependent oxidoreductase (luciferase family)